MSLDPKGRGRPPGKKKKRGPTPSVSYSGKGSPISYRSLFDVDRKQVHREYMRERATSSPNQPRESPTPKRRAISHDDKENCNKPGRPPLDKDHGPMKENSLKERRKELRQQKQHAEKISETRRTAVSFRWDKTKNRGDFEAEDGDGQSDDEEIYEEDYNSTKDGPSTRTVRRYEGELREIVPVSLRRQCELLKKAATEFEGSGLVVEKIAGCRETPKASFARYNTPILALLKKLEKKFSILPSLLIKSWAQFLIKADAEIFTSTGLDFSDKRDIPVSVLARQESDRIWNDIMKNKRRNDTRSLYLTHTIRVIKEVNHWKGHEHGEIVGLARAVGVTEEFAARVVKHVRDGKEKDLFKRKTRNDALRASGLIQDLEEFLLQPCNSRTCPGDTVSVGYRVRKDKFLLKETKLNLIKQFKVEHPECKFSDRVILRDWPRNFVTPSSRDRRRNVCPIHNNYHRLLEALHTVEIGTNIPPSCRSACCLAMCDSDRDPMHPPDWKKDCAVGDCPSCPDLSVYVDEMIDTSTTLEFTQWRKDVAARKTRKGEQKEIYGLFKVTMTIQDAVEYLQDLTAGLKLHIYTAYNQWKAKKLAEESLKVGSILFVDDYQMNLTVELAETTTSTVYGANNVLIAIFPVVVMFRREETGPVEKATITFFSDDILHDHQQVQMFEKRAVEIVKERTGNSFSHSIRFSDGCGAQFKSQFCVADLTKSPNIILQSPDGSSEAHFFASHEGKSESDTAGSLEKLRAERLILRNKDLVITEANHLVDAMNGETEDVSSSTQKYSFRVVESFPPFERVKSNQRTGIPLKGIRKLHFIGYRNGGLKASQLSCLLCMGEGGTCEGCASKEFTVKPEAIRKRERKGEDTGDDEEETFEENEEMMEEEEEDCNDGDPTGMVVLEELSEEEMEENEENCDDSNEEKVMFEEGDIVWAPVGRLKLPAKLISRASVPSAKRKAIETKQVSYYLLKAISNFQYSGQLCLSQTAGRE